MLRNYTAQYRVRRLSSQWVIPFSEEFVAALLGLSENGGIFSRLAKSCHQRIELQIVIRAKSAFDGRPNQPRREIIPQTGVEKGGLAISDLRVVVSENVVLDLLQKLFGFWWLGGRVTRFDGTCMEETALR